MKSRDRWPAGEMRRLVPPRVVEGRRVTELAWLYTTDEGRAAQQAACSRGIGCILGERAALKLVRSILPGLANRRDPFVRTAWLGFKDVRQGGYVGYLERPLRAWARRQARKEARAA